MRLILILGLIIISGAVCASDTSAVSDIRNAERIDCEPPQDDIQSLSIVLSITSNNPLANASLLRNEETDSELIRLDSMATKSSLIFSSYSDQFRTLVALIDSEGKCAEPGELVVIAVHRNNADNSTNFCKCKAQQ